jgi:hypothetical protein
MRTLQEIAERKKQSVRRTARAALLRELKNKSRPKNLNDRRGSWADDPNFEKSVLDFGNV